MEGTTVREDTLPAAAATGLAADAARAAVRGRRWPRAMRGHPDELLFDARASLALLGAPPAEPELIGALALAARVVSTVPGELIFRRDEAAHTLVFLREGEAVLGRRAEPPSPGRPHVVRPVRGPAWLDQGSLWLGAGHALDAWATSPALVLQWSRDDLLPLLQRHPGLSLRLLANLAGELRGQVEQTHGLMHLDAAARFAQWLVERCPQPQGSGVPALRLAHRKRDIAGALAITPETLSRVMRLLSTRGLISVQGYSVQVHDLPALERLALGAQNSECDDGDGSGAVSAPAG